MDEQEQRPESESIIEEAERDTQEHEFPKIKWLNAKKHINDLKLHSDNPRIITAEDVQDMQDSMDEFGYFDPIIVNLDNVLISGHKRVMALLEMGFNDEIDVRVPNRLLSPEEHTKLMLLANKFGSGRKHWDWEKLINNFDEELLEEVGFTSSELEGFFADTKKIEEDINKSIEDDTKEEDKPEMKRSVICPNCGEEIVL